MAAHSLERIGFDMFTDIVNYDNVGNKSLQEVLDY